MAINVEEAFTVEEFGIVFSNSNDDVALYITAGTGSPVGTQAPVPTLYVQSTGEIWRKTDTGVNDWEVLKVIDFNLDGGFANSVYTPSECIDGGDANG